MNKLLDLAKTNNIELEVLEKDNFDTNIVILNDNIEKYETSNEKKYEVKAKINNRIVKYNTENIDNILEILKENASIIDSDVTYDFISDTENNIDVNTNYKEIDYKNILNNMLSLNKLKEKYKELISINISFDHNITNLHLYNTNGVSKKDTNQIFCYYGELVININNENITAFFYILNVDLDKLDLNKIVEEKIEEAYFKSKAVSTKTDKYNIIISSESMNKILKAFNTMFKKELIDKKLSPLMDKINEKVFSDKITIVEDPTNPTLVGKRLFDTEGVNTYYKEIVKAGVFITPLYDNKTAKKDDVKSTGNSFGVRNMYIMPGTLSEEELLNKLKDGIYISNVEGLHAGVNFITTNISLQAEGYRVENGKKVEALKMIILSTSLFELLNNVESVGSNLEFYSSICGSPSILFNNISVAGNVK